MSKEILKFIFRITNEQILSNISCHITLKSNATAFEMILFIADKLE